MTLFDKLVDEALVNQKAYSSLRIVVEKELFHHEILRIMSESGLLKSLTFIGGTCLRDCYGSNRLSEDLDFTGGGDFDKNTLDSFSREVVKSIKTKYGFSVSVSEPEKEIGNVDTWKIKIETRPDRPDFPSQKIHLYICSLPSYEREPMMLLNHYGVELGSGGLIVYAQSRREILTDKFIALGLRPNRVKNRDLWDIVWLTRSRVKASSDLMTKKLIDRFEDPDLYIEKMDMRVDSLTRDPLVREAFTKEMSRFLPLNIVHETVESLDFWKFLSKMISDEWADIKAEFKGMDEGFSFRM